MKNQGDIQSPKTNYQIVTAVGFDPALPVVPDSVFKFKWS